MLLSVPSPSTLVQNQPPQSWFETQTVKSVDSGMNSAEEEDSDQIEGSEISGMLCLGGMGGDSDQVESKIKIKKIIRHLCIMIYD